MRYIAFISLMSIIMLSCQNTKDSKLQSTLTEDDFIGIFDLDPDRSMYEFGPEITNATYKIERFDYQYKFTTEKMDSSDLPNKVENRIKEGKTIEDKSYTILKVLDGTRLFIDKYDTDGNFIQGSMQELIVENEQVILRITQKAILPNELGYYINKHTYIKR